MKRQREEMRMDEQLSAYIDGALTPQERVRLEAQLAAEPALQERLEALQQTVTLLRQLPQVPAPRNFILTPAMVRPEPSPPPRQPLRWLAPALSLATAASAVLSAVVLVTSLVAVRQATPTTALFEGEGGAIEVAEMRTADATALSEAVVPAPGENAADDSTVQPPLAQEQPVEETPWPSPTVEAEAAESVVTETAMLSVPVGIGGGEVLPTATPLATPTEAPLVQEVPAPAEPAPAEPAPGEDERGAEETFPPAAAEPVPLPQPPTMPWLPLSGLGSLTIALAIASISAWRARRG